MKTEYQKPKIAVISLITAEKITVDGDGADDGMMGLESGEL